MASVATPPNNWAELVQSKADKKVKSKNHHANHPASDAEQLLTHKNHPKTRMLILSTNPDSDKKLLEDIIMKDVQKKADSVTYLVESIHQFNKNGVFQKDDFIFQIKNNYRPTIIVMKSKETEFQEAFKALTSRGNCLINSTRERRQLTESNDGNMFYTTKNITVPEQEPVVGAFSVQSNQEGTRNGLTEILREYEEERVLIYSGSHGEQERIAGESGLSNEQHMNNKFYIQDCAIVGIEANPSQFNEDSDGDFDSWKTPSFIRPNILNVTPRSPMPHNALLKDPKFDKMTFQVVNVANYHNRPDLRASASDSDEELKVKANKRTRECVKDILDFDPTVIFIATCFSSNGDIALALRSEGVFSSMILQHDLRKITGKSGAKLDDSQKAVLKEMSEDGVKHAVLGGASGTGKTLLGCEFVKIQAAKLTKNNPEAKINIDIVHMNCNSDSVELFTLWKTKFFNGMAAFQPKYWTSRQFRDEHGLQSIDFKDRLRIIKESCTKIDKENQQVTNNCQQQSLTIILFDEVCIKPTRNKQDCTGLEALDKLATVYTATCINPAGTVAGGGEFTLELPTTRATQNQSTSLFKSWFNKLFKPVKINSFCCRELTVGYRNTPAIRQFNNFYMDHLPTNPLLSRTKFSLPSDVPPGPAGEHAVTWLQCSSVPDMASAVNQMVLKHGNQNPVVLYWDRDGEDVCEKAAQSSGANKVVDSLAYFGCEDKTVVYVINYGPFLEATSRAMEKLVLVTGPDLGPATQYLLQQAADNQHTHNVYRKHFKCKEDPCPWPGSETVDQFPLVDHLLICPTKDCGNIFQKKNGQCDKCGSNC